MALPTKNIEELPGNINVRMKEKLIRHDIRLHQWVDEKIRKDVRRKWDHARDRKYKEGNSTKSFCKYSHKGIKLMFVLFQEIEQIIIKITLLILLIRYCLIIILQS